MRDGMRVVSLFSGLGAFDLGLELAGMEIVGQVEIDPTCLRVLEHHWPDVRRWTDVRSVDAVGCTDEAHPLGVGRGPVAGVLERAGRSAGELRPDLICGGFPCQDVSVAGQRAGLDGARSGLWFEFQRILRELRPRWAIIENVPGLLSSNQGADFGVILDGLGECGFGGISWAVLDSQHFGVPQRRRRVFVVCGPTARSTEQVLSLCESCGGHPAAGRTEREAVAAALGASTTSSGGQRYDLDSDTYAPELVPALTRRDDKSTREDIAAQTSANGKGFNEEGLAYTLDGTEGQAVMGWDERNITSKGNRSTLSPISPTLHESPMSITGAAVRRLTPTECLRLQGLPDDWLDLGLADGPKYRMVGNAVTVSVVEYLGRRILELDR